MASERWASPATMAVAYRRISCGHREMLRNASEAKNSCQQCLDTVNFVRLPPTRDYVPLPNLTWASAQCIASDDLSQAEFKDGETPSSIETLAVALSPSAMPEIFLEDSQPLRSTQRPAAREFHVWRVATEGSSVHSGVLELPERGILLLTGHGVRFNGTAFRGGSVICGGGKYSGTFQNCAFHGTTLYAVHGASIILRSCNIRNSPAGLVVSGMHTLATLHACDVSGCRRSVAADAAAVVAMHECRIHHTDAGVTVTGHHTAAAAHSTSFVGGLSHTFGVHAFSGMHATIRMHDCSIENFLTAFCNALSTCAVEAHGLVVAKVTSAFLLGYAQLLVLRESHVRVMPRRDLPDPVVVALGSFRDDVPQGIASGAGYAGGQLERCTFFVEGPKGDGVVVNGGSSMHARSCHIDCPGNPVALESNSPAHATLLNCFANSKDIGVTAAGADSRLRVRGGVICGETAVHAHTGAKLSATDCEFRSRCDAADFSFSEDGSGGEVVVVTDGAHAWLVRTCIHGGTAGVFTFQADAVVKDTQIRNVHHKPGSRARREAAGEPVLPACGYKCNAGRVVISGGSVRSSEEGILVPPNSLGGQPIAIEAAGVTIEDCHYGARFLPENFTAELSKCTFRGPVSAVSSRGRTCSTGVLMGDEGSGRAKIDDCVFVGFTYGVHAECDGGAMITNCLFREGRGRAYYVSAQTQGEVSVHGCRFIGAPRSEGEPEIIAVDARRGTSVKVSGRTMIERCANGLRVNAGATMTAADVSILGAAGGRGIVAEGPGASFHASRVKISGHGQITCMHAGNQSKGRLTVRLEDCDLHDSNQGVVAAFEAVHLTMRNCRVSGCPYSGMVVAGAVSCELSNVSISKCYNGIYTGVVDGSDPECRVCGRSGQLAIYAARFALRDCGGVPPPAARCVHTGAVAKLSIRDTTIARCRGHGIKVGMHARANAQRVTVTDCRAGISVEYIGAPSVFSDCRLVTCLSGAFQREETRDGPADSVHIPGVEIVDTS